MFSFNEQTKYQNNQIRLPTTTTTTKTKTKTYIANDNNRQQPGQAQVRSFIDRLKLKPSPAFNVKLKQQSQQLCAKLNRLQYGRLKDDLQRSLGKFVQTSAARKPNAANTANTANSRLENVTRRTRSSFGNGVVVSVVPALGGKKQPSNLQRSFSLNPRPSLVKTIAAAEQQAAALRRNEWATRSLQQANAAKANIGTVRQQLSSEDSDERACKRPFAPAARQQQQHRSPLAARLMKWPSLAGGGGEGAKDERTRQKSPPRNKSKQEQVDCEKSRSQSIVSLLSSAAASRRQTKRPATSDRFMPAGARFMFVAALQLLLVLVSLLAPLQPVSVDCAPISQYMSIQPIWLSDNIMDLPGSSSLDGDHALQAAPIVIDAMSDETSGQDEAANGRDLLQQMADMQQQQQQQQNELEGRAGDQVKLDYLEQQQQQQEPSLPIQLGLPYTKRRADDAQEYLWIERRRLNRDRALEPPAWLRTRPIRRDFVGSAPIEGQEEGEGAAVEQQDQASAASARPNMRRRSSGGRQLRESTSETYDQILKHLLEEAIENGSLLAELYDDLETRARSQQRVSSAKMTQLEPGLMTSAGDVTSAEKNNVGKQPEGLVVAGDEISSEDDVTPVDLPMVLLAPLPRPFAVTRGNQPIVQAPNQQVDQPAQFHSPPNGNLPMRLPSDLVTSIDVGTSPAGSGAAGLIEIIEQTAGPVNQQREPSFHVIEDIDRVDLSQEVQQDQQQPGDQSAGNSQAEAAFRLDKRSIELDSSIVGDFKEEDERQQDEGPVTVEQHDQLPVPAQIQQVVVARRASFGRGSDESVRSQKNSAQQPGVNRSLAATAIRLIRSGYFTRAQLIQFATKMRVFLENRLGLARGAITGLFPVDKQRLLVELNPERITRDDRLMLMRNFDFARKSNSLVLSWPSGTSSQLPVENPLPMLSAILGALYDDEPVDQTSGAARDEQEEEEQDDDDDERMQFEEVAPKTTGVQINELPPVASALVARDSSQQRSEEANLADQQGDEEHGGKEENEAPTRTSLLMSPVVPARRYVPAQLAQLNEAPPLSAPSFEIDQQQLDWVPRAQAMWDDNYQSRRRVAMLASYLNALYGFNQFQQPPRPLVLPPEFALWNHELAAGGALDSAGGVAVADPNATLGEVGVVSTPAIYRRLLAVMGFDSLPAAHTQLTGMKPPATLWSHHALAIVLALVVTFVIVKLILKRLDTTKRDGGKRRRLSTMTGSSSTSTFCERARQWSSSPGKWWPSTGMGRQRSRESECESAGAQGDLEAAGTIKGETLSCSTKQNPLGKAFTHQTKRKPSTDSGLETIDGTEVGGTIASGSSEKIRRSFEHLTRRLTRLLSIMRSDEQQQMDKCDDIRPAADLEGAGPVGEKGVPSPSLQGQPQQFRSSTSYIRSLIEALTKAASAQMSGSGQVSALNDDDDDDDDDEENEEDDDKLSSLEMGLAKQQQQQQPEQVFQPEDDTEILMAQMDISAAHLILDYMEKHLVDKERLRREWLELNGAAGATPPLNNGGRSALPGPSTSVTTSKANQLVLQRLAKIALNEDNYHKNRNPNVVPFDRNRVRLGAGKRASGNGCEPPSTPAPTTSKQKLRNQRNARNGSRNTAGLDYINASFIYDDDPRRATHIIGQGPKEQTCGQFWQMVWEQEISVIVMLTRLNENSAQMCHCYWPTQIGSAQVGDTTDGVAGKPELSPPLGGGGGGTNGSARRGSVTSVFSSLAAGKHHPNSSAIVAGAPNDTALYFELPLASAPSSSRQGSRQTSRSSAEDDLEEAAGTPTSSLDKKSRGGVAPGSLKLEVRLISEHVSSSDYLVRNMYLINRATGETRTISQFHYLAWQEGKTPESVRSFLQFRRKVHKSYRNPASPILVHCSDGAGRSGTYALIDIILERIRNGAKEIDLRATLEHLRDQRIGLCENQAQFEFVLVALAEEIQIILNALPQ